MRGAQIGVAGGGNVAGGFVATVNRPRLLRRAGPVPGSPYVHSVGIDVPLNCILHANMSSLMVSRARARLCFSSRSTLATTSLIAAVKNKTFTTKKGFSVFSQTSRGHRFSNSYLSDPPRENPTIRTLSLWATSFSSSAPNVPRLNLSAGSILSLPTKKTEIQTCG